jgi:hypothetical protein
VSTYLLAPYKKPLPTCYGCIHLKYRGPFGILSDDEAILAPGGYHCNLFQTSRGGASSKPQPLTNRCKETR